MPKNASRSTISHLHKLEIMLETAQGLQITEKLLACWVSRPFTTIHWIIFQFLHCNSALVLLVIQSNFLGTNLFIFILILKSLESRQFIVCKVCVKGGCSNGNQMRLDERRKDSQDSLCHFLGQISPAWP